ncbi:hypothetical protein NE686_17965 [Tissierella carlieri]|uniref:Uncharacterized protein n=1 Tax=Tissierella carlieri TaxID=689904 RepID=A0ABT1SGE6_9FIRM|nr:hypothetical protein [Tissierella carlieri]MCQ4924992.1 hypothetical protein [Tissierella carlieri]
MTTNFERTFLEKFKEYYGDEIHHELIAYVLDNCDILYHYNKESCNYCDGKEYENLLFAIVEEDERYYYLLNMQIDYYTTESQVERLVRLTPDEMINYLRLIILDDKDRISYLENKHIEMESHLDSLDKRIDEIKREHQIDISMLDRFKDYQVLLEMYNYYKNIQPFQLNKSHSDHRSLVYKFSPKAIYWDGSGARCWRFRSEQGRWDYKRLSEEKAREIYLEELKQLIDKYKEEFLPREKLFR